MCGLFPISADRPISNGLEPAIRKLGLQRIPLGGVLLPKILLAEPDDVILFEPAIAVKGFILGNEVLVGASSDRARDPARIHLRAGVEHVRNILDADAVAVFNM